MKIKQAFVTRENPAEIFSIIEDTLSTRPNTQVFVDNQIYEELRSHGGNYNVSTPNNVKSGHYYYNDLTNYGGEEWLELHESRYYSPEIARGSFISNCKEYIHLVEFHSSKVRDYTHYFAGFKQLLLIQFKPES